MENASIGLFILLLRQLKAVLPTIVTLYVDLGGIYQSLHMLYLLPKTFFFIFFVINMYVLIGNEALQLIW